MNCCPSQPALGPPPTSTVVFRCDCFFAMEIRENVLTESNIRDLVKLLDEEMDGAASEQRERLQNIEEELEDVKKRLARIWNHIETTDTEMADASDRIREHREPRRRRLANRPRPKVVSTRVCPTTRPSVTSPIPSRASSPHLEERTSCKRTTVRRWWTALTR